MNKLTYIVHKIDTLSEWSGKILFPLVLFLALTIVYEVISRFLFNRPTTWGTELSTMIYGVYVIAGGAYALLYAEHVRMDLLYSRWSKRTKAIVDSCTFPFFFLLCGVLLWKSGVYGWESVLRLEHSIRTPWAPPLYPWKMTIPVAALLILLQGMSKLIRDVTFAIKGREL